MYTRRLRAEIPRVEKLALRDTAMHFNRECIVSDENVGNEDAIYVSRAGRIAKFRVNDGVDNIRKAHFAK